MKSEKLKSFNYAIGMFGTSIPINLLKTYAAIFYVDRLGLKTTQFALILFVYTFIDVLDNPVYGFLSDRTRTKWGRRRPWLIIGTPLLVLGLIAFYSPPEFLAGQSLLAYAMLFYILTGTLDSVINANYGALFPELFTDDASRAKTNAMRQAFQLVAMIISIALTPIVTNAIGFSTTAILYGILGGVVIIHMALTAREKEIEPDAQSTFLFASVLLIAIACVVLWAWLVRKYSLLLVWRIALGALALAFIPLYFAHNLVTAIAASALVGFGFAGVITTMDLIGARIMDEDTRKYNVRREGIYSNALGFMNRLSGLFTSLAFLLIFHLFGFESGDNPGSQPGTAARFLLTIFPLVLMVISLGFSFFLKFKQNHDENIETMKTFDD
ncbi:MAG TPA: MFS transporter [Anaerolineaceae bacterium]|nr:MAG: hypothetical protein XE06_0759 [Anaerolineaceae bacterium 46_22]HAF49170.1 MFS transporter [Anaerolineaceae bacterium]